MSYGLDNTLKTLQLAETAMGFMDSSRQNVEHYKSRAREREAFDTAHGFLSGELDFSNPDHMPATRGGLAGMEMAMGFDENRMRHQELVDKNAQRLEVQARYQHWQQLGAENPDQILNVNPSHLKSPEDHMAFSLYVNDLKQTTEATEAIRSAQIRANLTEFEFFKRDMTVVDRLLGQDSPEAEVQAARILAARSTRLNNDSKLVPTEDGKLKVYRMGEDMKFDIDTGKVISPREALEYIQDWAKTSEDFVRAQIAQAEANSILNMEQLENRKFYTDGKGNSYSVYAQIADRNNVNSRVTYVWNNTARQLVDVIPDNAPDSHERFSRLGLVPLDVDKQMADTDNTRAQAMDRRAQARTRGGQGTAQSFTSKDLDALSARLLKVTKPQSVDGFGEQKAGPNEQMAANTAADEVANWVSNFGVDPRQAEAIAGRLLNTHGAGRQFEEALAAETMKIAEQFGAGRGVGSGGDLSAVVEDIQQGFESVIRGTAPEAREESMLNFARTFVSVMQKSNMTESEVRQVLQSLPPDQRNVFLSVMGQGQGGPTGPAPVRHPGNGSDGGQGQGRSESEVGKETDVKAPDVVDNAPPPGGTQPPSPRERTQDERFREAPLDMLYDHAVSKNPRFSEVYPREMWESLTFDEKQAVIEKHGLNQRKFQLPFSISFSPNPRDYSFGLPPATD